MLLPVVAPQSSAQFLVKHVAIAMEHEFISRVVAKPASIQELDRPVIVLAK